MDLRMYCFALCIISVSWAQDAKRPLPAANNELITHYKLALDAIFGMGIRLQALLQDEQNENFLVSPISAATIVAEMMLGAEGEFQEQLVELLSLPNSYLYKNDKVHKRDKNESYSLPYSTLHLQLSGLLKALSNRTSKKQFTLKQSSALFYDKNIQLKEFFARHLKDLYSANLREVDFLNKPIRTQKIINGWASKNTNDLIKTILPRPAPPTTASILANAVYFLAEWENPFSDELNKIDSFTVNPEKQVNVTYMMGLVEQIFYVESEDYRMIALPYKNEELGMYILLPRPESRFKYDMKGFARSLKAGEILDTISRGRRRDVVVKIPKMTVSSSFSILDQLKKYRVFKKQNVESRINNNAVDPTEKLENKVEAFNNFTTSVDKEIYLTNASTDGRLRLGDIVQQVVLSVNEKGTEAAAVSAGTIDYIGGSKNFVVDRPFLFFIRHEATSASLFWGTVSNPVSS